MKLRLNEFGYEVQNRLSEELHNRGYEKLYYELTTVKKNNGTEIPAMIIKEEESVIAPSINLSGYYESYMSGNTIENICYSIADTYEDCLQSMPTYEKDVINVNKESFLNKTFFQLVNYDKNSSMLKASPHKKYLDMAVIYRELVSNNGDGIASYIISNAQMDRMGITPEELDKAAVENTPNLFPAMIVGVGDILGAYLDEEDKALMEDAPYQLYVLSNTSKINGAGAMLYEDIISNFAGDRDMYILPSSIHEVLLLEKIGDNDEEELKTMVRDINRNEVSNNEILSDNVYLYNGREKKITLVDEKEKSQILESDSSELER